MEGDRVSLISLLGPQVVSEPFMGIMILYISMVCCHPYDNLYNVTTTRILPRQLKQSLAYYRFRSFSLQEYLMAPSRSA
jgi:hypothetical protein